MIDVACRIAVVMYAVSSLLYFYSLARKRKGLSITATWILGVGLAVHSVGLVLMISGTSALPIVNLHGALHFFSWCVVGMFIGVRGRYGVTGLGIIVAPLATMLTLWATGSQSLEVAARTNLSGYWLVVHGLLALGGEAVFALAFAAGVLYLIQDARIKRKRAGPGTGGLPSLEALDEMNSRCLSLGFPLLTAGIITGSVWASDVWGSYWSWDPKETWSLMTWFVYAALLHQRLNVGWRGRRAAIMAILGFAFVLFTFVGVNLLLPGLHSFRSLRG